MIDILRDIHDKKVERLFLVVWPPYGEEDLSQLDISAGYVLEDRSDKLFVISTDKDDLTSPIVHIQSIPENYFSWNDFEPRIQDWVNCVEGMKLDTEFYEISNVEVFGNIINHRIETIELIEVGINEIIGIKLIFNKDFVLSIPIDDGNTIETSRFNQNKNIQHFKTLGEIKFRNINELGNGTE